MIDNLFEINLFISQLASSNKKELKKEKLSIMFHQFQGKQESDSCEPPSSILDIDSEQIHVPAPAPLVSEVSVRESEADTSKDVSDIESDWDEDLVPSDLPSSDNNISSNNNTRVKQTSAVVISNKRSIFIQPKKIKKFSL